MNVTSTSTDARSSSSTWVWFEAWIIIAASTPSNRPSSSMTCLPARSSSAGVPRNTTVPGSSLRIEASAIAAPTPAALIRLWPQPWPRPRRESYSARIATVGPGPGATLEAAADGRLERPRRPFHVVAVAGEGLGDPARGLALLEPGLRMSVNAVREVEDLRTVRLDGGGEAIQGPAVGRRCGSHLRVSLLRWHCGACQPGRAVDPPRIERARVNDEGRGGSSAKEPVRDGRPRDHRRDPRADPAPG